VMTLCDDSEQQQCRRQQCSCKHATGVTLGNA
jgi:hypothetical protein